MEETPDNPGGPLRRVYKTRARPFRKLKDVTLLNEQTGEPSSISFPVAQMSREQYLREMQQKYIVAGHTEARRYFLSKIDLEDLKFALAGGLRNNPKAGDFLGCLMDPSMAGMDIAELAEECGISLTSLMAIWRDSRLSLALSSIFTGIPTIVEDTIEDAKRVTVCCNRCDGAGEFQVTKKRGSVWRTCPNCGGSGEVQKAGEAKSREFTFKASGLIKPDSAQVNVSVNNMGANVTSVIDELESIPIVPVSISEDKSDT